MENKAITTNRLCIKYFYLGKLFFLNSLIVLHLGYPLQLIGAAPSPSRQVQSRQPMRRPPSFLPSLISKPSYDFLSAQTIGEIRKDKAMIDQTDDPNNLQTKYDYDKEMLSAAEKGNADMVEILINSGANIEATTRWGETALIIAAQNGHAGVVKILINSGANIEATTSIGETALIIAAQNGHAGVVEILINSGANIEATTSRGETALIIATRTGEADVVEILINSGANMDVTTRSGETALLITLDQNISSSREESNQRRKNIAILLINAGAHVNISNDQGQTPLIRATEMGYQDIVDLLIKKGAYLNAQSKRGNTALMVASLRDKAEIFLFLLNAGANPDIADIKNGMTPLMVASFINNTYFVGQLVNAHANLNAQSVGGKTALMFASEEGETAVVNILIQEGAKVDITDKEDNTALILAAGKGHKEITEKLIKAGANINAQNIKGSTALMAASINNHQEVVETLTIKSKAATDSVTWNGNTALMLAAEKGHVNIVKTLISAGADINKINLNKQSALMIASDKKFADIVELLTNAGAKQSDTVEHMLKSWPIQKKSCIITFEQNDGNSAVTNSVVSSLLDNTIVIASAHILNNLADTQYKFLEDMFKSRKLSLFLREEKKLGVIIPEFISDEASLREHYGLLHLNYIKPDNVVQTLKDLAQVKKPENFADLINQFKEIIDKNANFYPQRFYLDGHGSAKKGIIAAIPLHDINTFLAVLNNDINAQFLYINTCYAGGTNLEVMQLELQKIVEENLKKHLSEEPVSKGIKYPIIIQATSDVPTLPHKAGLGLFFNRLDEFLKNPLWALGYTRSKKTLHITDVINSLELWGEESLPAIRFPGTMSFFRSIDLKNMIIITWLGLQTMRSEKLFYEVKKQRIKRQINWIERQNELAKRLKNVKYIGKQEEKFKPELQRLKQQLEEHMSLQPQQQGPLFTIKEGIKYIQVFPCDLSDCTFVVESSEMPKFISKIPGQGQHFIGTIRYTSQQATAEHTLEKFVSDGFTPRLRDAYATSKCWFVKSVELSVAGKQQIIKDLIIKIDQEIDELDASISPWLNVHQEINNPHLVSYVYKNNDGSYIKRIRGFAHEPITRQEFENLAREWYDSTTASFNALFEATGGHEISYTPEEKTNANLFLLNRLSYKSKINKQRIIYEAKERTSDILLDKFLH